MIREVSVEDAVGLDDYASLANLAGAVRELRTEAGSSEDGDSRHRNRLKILRLVLAGPDPASIQDDPEGQEVVRELVAAYRRLSPEDQADVAILTLPMDTRKENALMVNALQRCSTTRTRSPTVWTSFSPTPRGGTFSPARRSDACTTSS